MAGFALSTEDFVALLESIRPRPEFLRLFRAVVLDCWKAQSDQSAEARAEIERRLLELRQKLDRIEAAFVLEKSIDRRSYEGLRDKAREDVALTELRLSEARIEQIDGEGILGFAEYVIGNAAALWTAASPADRRALQAALFPEGLARGPQGFGTAVTCKAFSYLREISTARDGVASPAGFDTLRTVLLRTLTAAAA